MKKIFILLFVLSIYGVNLAQDTLSVDLYKKHQSWGPQTNDIKKAKFAKYKIENKDGSLTTIYYSFMNKKISSSSTFKGNEPYGIWITTSYRNGKEYEEEIDYNFDLVYCEDSNLDEDVYDRDKIKALEETDTFVKAEPVGGIDAVHKVVRAVDYPQMAIDNDIEGKVYVSFVVNTDGTLSDFCVIRGVHILLDKASMKQVRKLFNFVPATLNGEKVRSTAVVPIVFKLA